MWEGRTMKFLNGFADGSMLKDMDRILTEDTFGYYVGPTLMLQDELMVKQRRSLRYR